MLPCKLYNMVRESRIKKEPSQKFLKKACENGGMFRDARRIYQAEYSQAQRRFWYFPIVYDRQPNVKGYQLIKK